MSMIYVVPVSGSGASSYPNCPGITPLTPPGTSRLLIRHGNPNGYGSLWTRDHLYINGVFINPGSSGVLAGLIPGIYRLQARARGYSPVDVVASIPAGDVQILLDFTEGSHTLTDWYDACAIRDDGPSSSPSSGKGEIQFASRQGVDIYFDDVLQSCATLGCNGILSNVSPGFHKVSLVSQSTGETRSFMVHVLVGRRTTIAGNDVTPGEVLQPYTLAPFYARDQSTQRKAFDAYIYPGFEPTSTPSLGCATPAPYKTFGNMASYDASQSKCTEVVVAEEPYNKCTEGWIKCDGNARASKCYVERAGANTYYGSTADPAYNYMCQQLREESLANPDIMKWEGCDWFDPKTFHVATTAVPIPGAPTTPPICVNGQTACDGTTLLTCAGGVWVPSYNSPSCGYVAPTPTQPVIPPTIPSTTQPAVQYITQEPVTTTTTEYVYVPPTTQPTVTTQSTSLLEGIDDKTLMLVGGIGAIALLVMLMKK